MAIKKMLHPFESEKHSQRTYRELKLLMYLNHPDAHVWNYSSNNSCIFDIAGCTIVQCIYTWKKSTRISNTVRFKKTFVFLIDTYSFVLICRYMVFNFVDYDLNKVILRQKPFPEDHIKLIIYSLLLGLKVKKSLLFFLYSSTTIFYFVMV